MATQASVDNFLCILVLSTKVCLMKIIMPDILAVNVGIATSGHKGIPAHPQLRRSNARKKIMTINHNVSIRILDIGTKILFEKRHYFDIE
jgi:hypothetical protein